MRLYRLGEAIEQRGRAPLFLLIIDRIKANSAVHAGYLGLLGKTVICIVFFDKFQFCANRLLYFDETRCSYSLDEVSTSQLHYDRVLFSLEMLSLLKICFH